MPTYRVNVSFAFEDSIYLEAEDMHDAMAKAEHEFRDSYSVLSNDGGYTVPWDDISATEAYEEEE